MVLEMWSTARPEGRGDGEIVRMSAFLFFFFSFSPLIN